MKPTPSKRRSIWRWLAIVIVFLGGAGAVLVIRLGPELRPRHKISPGFQLASPLLLAALPTAARFDFPIGSENGAFAYNAQRFTENGHLGDDLNGIGGENSDLDDPVFAVADGQVLYTGEGGPGWGNVIILLHAYEEKGARKFVESYYGHVETILVELNQKVSRGEQIATVGTAGGRYLAHLHFEMREFTTPFIGPGYRDDTSGWIDPTAFITAHRGAPDDDVGRTLPQPNAAE